VRVVVAAVLTSTGRVGFVTDAETTPPPPAAAGLLPTRWTRTGRSLAVTWLVSRLIMVGLFWLTAPFITGDVSYYWRKLEAMRQVGLSNTLNEYPTPVVWILEIPHLVTFGNQIAYVLAFIVGMAVLDAVMTALLWRTAGRRPHAGVDAWLLFPWLIGMLIYVRFDMIPAVLVGAALVLVSRRPGLAGALIGLGAAVKLWPALLFPALLAQRGTRRPFTIGFVVVGVGLALLSLLTGGVRRLFSPLTWQSGRGLQIESVWATPLMLARAFAPGTWRVEMSSFQAYEVFGIGVDGWLAVSTVATVLGIAAIVALVIRAFRHPDPDTWHLSLLVLAVVMIMIVTNKTLSPQYMLWAGGPVAMALIAAGREPDRVRPTRRLAWGAMVLALLTQLVYPLGYDYLLSLRGGQAALVASTLVLALRNLALLGYTGWVVLLTFTRLSPHRTTKVRTNAGSDTGPVQ